MDPKGSGKMSIRGGYAIQYEESFYNALSNSRWNLPYYSFNEAAPLLGLSSLPVYGPTNPDGTAATAVAPTFSGSPTQAGAVGNGPAGSGFKGNLMGWFPGNPNLAALTGIPSPNYTLPYYENAFFGVQREIAPNTTLEVDYVGTWGRHLFWAEIRTASWEAQRTTSDGSIPAPARWFLTRRFSIPVLASFAPGTLR